MPEIEMIQEKEIKSIYMIAICGTAMGTLAAMLKERGFQVYGVDSHVYPPMSTFLEQKSIPVYQGFDEKHLDHEPDLVIIGNAMSRGNPEVEAVLEKRIPYMSSAEALKNFFIQGKRSIVVSGTHGKTTTSSLTAWLLDAAGKEPSFMVGGIPKNFNQGYKLGKSDLFVVEGDEYDTAFFDKAAKFFHYLPHTLIINNIEFDHGDIYSSLDEIKLAFRRLVNLVPRNGLFLANIEDENVQEMIPRSFAPVQTFGISKDAFWRAENIDYQPDKTVFDIIRDGKFFARVESPLFGTHNIRNVLAATGAAAFYGVSAEQVQTALPKFQNIVKRLELKGIVHDISIYDDFAHHPSKVRSTINGLRNRFPDSRIWAIFEPRTATSKMKIMEDQYARAFDDADFIIIAPLHLPQKIQAEKRMSVENLIEKIKKKKSNVYHFTTDQIVEFVADKAESGDKVLIMSNGAFDNVPQRLIEALEKRFS